MEVGVEPHPAFKHMGFVFALPKRNLTNVLSFYQRLLLENPNVILNRCMKKDRKTIIEVSYLIDKIYVIVTGTNQKHTAELYEKIEYEGLNEEFKFKDACIAASFRVRDAKKSNWFLRFEKSSSLGRVVVFAKTRDNIRVYNLDDIISHPTYDIRVGINFTSDNLDVQQFYFCQKVHDTTKVDAYFQPVPSANISILYNIEVYFKFSYPDHDFHIDSESIKLAYWNVVQSNFGTIILSGSEFSSQKECLERLTLYACPHEEVEYAVDWALFSCFISITTKHVNPCLFIMKVEDSGNKLRLEFMVPLSRKKEFLPSSQNSSRGSQNASAAVPPKRPLSKWTYVVLTGEIVVQVENKDLKEFARYIRNNITHKKATHILYLGKNQNQVKSGIKKDFSVHACSILVLVHSTGEKPEVSFHKYKSNNLQESPLSYNTKLIGLYITIFQTNQIPESWVEVTGEMRHDLYVVCASVVEQSWKLVSALRPDQSVVNVLVNETYFFEVSIVYNRNTFELELYCHTSDGEVIEVDKEKGEGGFNVSVARSVSFYCYVEYGENFIRYYNTLLISSSQALEFEKPSRLYNTNGENSIYIKFSGKDSTLTITTSNHYPYVLLGMEKNIIKFTTADQATDGVCIVTIMCFDNYSNQSVFHNELYIRSSEADEYKMSDGSFKVDVLHYLNEDFISTETPHQYDMNTRDSYTAKKREERGAATHVTFQSPFYGLLVFWWAS